ncbi:MAG: hypothetical protein COA33_009825 [Fluviicola sp.]|nr:hypothetical protein [Fluviicola sp.]
MKKNNILKKIAGIAFAVAFLMAIVLFTGYGRSYISASVAKILFLIFGAIGFLFNLFSFNSEKKTVGFNFFFWTGGIILLIGFIFKIMHWPFSRPAIILGMIILGVSFVVPNKTKSKKNDDLLDDF